jgi:amino acid transporter
MALLALIICLLTVHGVSGNSPLHHRCFSLYYACLLIAIVSNGKIKSGGPYFLISRTLGLSLGGAIGVILLAEHVVANVFYLASVSEVINLAITVRRFSCFYSYEKELMRFL